MPLFKPKHRSTVPAILLLLAFAARLGAYQAPANGFRFSDEMRAAVNAISAASMREHLRFIASDELEGRNTPSPGLDRAAEYIAAQFKKAGLEAAGDDGYFQTATWIQTVRSPKDFSLSIQTGSETTKAAPSQVSFNFSGALNLQKVPLVKIDFNNTAAQAELKQNDVEGKAIIAEMPDFQRVERSRRSELFQAQRTFLALMQSLKAVLILSIDRNGTSGNGFAPGRAIDPEGRPPQAAAQTQALPVVQLFGNDFAKVFDGLKAGPNAAGVSINVAAPQEVPVKLRNVIGVLRGSDPSLLDTYVMVTAHYDHLGVNPNAPGPDKIFNGANDDGSGTVSVIEIATALAKLKPRPKRSLIFMTVFGEEKGLLGSRYYGRHPIFPIEKTVADVNLEQVGRTDDSEGPQVGTCAMTGFDFSDVGEIFKAAGELMGIKVFKHPTNSDAYFGRSDNQALADQGVPAHTLSVAYVYPDYHGVGDHWDKIDYDNMAKVDRMVAVGLLMIATNPTEPKWNEENPKAAKYVKAWHDRRGK
jgi:Peptidase family M28